MEDIEFPLTMTLSQAQRIVNIIAKQPYEDVADLVAIVKGAGDAAVARSRLKPNLVEQGASAAAGAL